MMMTEGAVERFEEQYPDGVTVGQVVAFFREQGVPLSEATFRRYVQLGFLPRCRRVGRRAGREGERARGSEGIYPTSTVRRLLDVKRLLDQHYTIEQIRGMFRVHEDDIQTVREGLRRIVNAAEEQLREAPDEILEAELSRFRATIVQLEAGLQQMAACVARGRMLARYAV